MPINKKVGSDGINMFTIIFIVILIAVMVIRDGKKGEAYSKKLTPTMRFIIAAGANTYQALECSRIDIGGNPANNWAKRHMRKLLKSGWNVDNADDLKETIFWLFNEGHNKDCMEMTKQYKGESESVQIKRIFESGANNVERILYTITEKYEKQGILAWDMCRACNIAGWGFLAQYITYEEAIQISIDACKILQNSYGSWDDMMESYFLGLWYWSSNYSTTQNRMSWYEHSKKNKDSIYNISWGTALDPQDVISPRKR